MKETDIGNRKYRLPNITFIVYQEFFASLKQILDINKKAGIP